jgi:protein-S-isoprenylcysteine O-methyltransferase Ste14
VTPVDAHSTTTPRTDRAAAAGTVVFAIAVPGTVAGLLPWWLAGRRQHPPLLGARWTRTVGTALIAAGVPLVADAFVRFVRARGTPAPIAETHELVVDGPYRITRNPQYVGVVAVVTGEGLLWGSGRVLAYAAYLAASFHRWVRVYEEPRLRHRFGAAYERYQRRVSRWLPRPSGVRPVWSDSSGAEAARSPGVFDDRETPGLPRTPPPS